MRAAERAREEELAGFPEGGPGGIEDRAREPLAQWVAERDEEASTGGRRGTQHEEFAGRAARRLETMADALEDEERRIERGTVPVRANEMRVAARIVRDMARTVTWAEDPFETLGSESRLASNQTDEAVEVGSRLPS